MAGLFQGDPLPNIQTTQTQATTTPQWYQTYLENLATAGQAAQKNSQFVGPTGLQQASYANVTKAANAAQPGLSGAMATTQNALNQASPLSQAQPYLNQATLSPTQLAANAQALTNPYIQNQVKAIGQLGEQNILQNIAPQATAGAVGTGQFGSKRGAEALGQAINQEQMNTTALQAQALQGGYQNALAAAQGQEQLGLSVGQTAGQLAGQGTTQQLLGGAQLGQLGQAEQQTGLAGINAQNALGTQEQQMLQQRQLYPFQTLGLESQLLQGAQLPTSTSMTKNAPIPGAYSASPLQQVAGLGTLANAVLPQTSISDALKKYGINLPTTSGSGTSSTGGSSLIGGAVKNGLDYLGNGLTNLFGYGNKDPNLVSRSQIGQEFNIDPGNAYQYGIEDIPT
jgi:hypothetical protein